MGPASGNAGDANNGAGTLGSLERSPGKASSSVLKDPGSITTGGSNAGASAVEGGRSQGGDHNQGQPR